MRIRLTSLPAALALSAGAAASLFAAAPAHAATAPAHAAHAGGGSSWGAAYRCDGARREFRHAVLGIECQALHGPGQGSFHGHVRLFANGLRAHCHGADLFPYPWAVRFHGCRVQEWPSVR